MRQLTIDEIKDQEEREEDRKKLSKARKVEPLIPDKAEAKKKLEIALKEEKEMNG